MTTTVEIPIPSELDKKSLVRYFSNTVDERYEHRDNLTGALRPVLDLIMEEERAHIETISINEVELTEDGIEIEYELHFSVTHGCRDLQYVGEDDRTISGEKVGDKWVFEKLQRYERTTLDEF